MARAMIAEPNERLVREEDEMNGTVEVVAAVPLEITVLRDVTAAGTVATDGTLEAVITPAGTEAGVGVPTTKAAEVDPPALCVENTTWGTVTAVESTERVEDDGMAVPLAEQGTVMVVTTEMVVIGTAIEVVAVTPDDGVTDAAHVMIAGLTSMLGAQIPWRYCCAASISASDAPWAERQSKTVHTKVSSVQKQLASELDAQEVENMKVFKHCGRTAGQGAVSAGGLTDVVTAGVVMTAAGEVVGIAVSEHKVQTVLVWVMRTVEVVTPVTSEVVPAEVWVRVTGQIVTEVSTTSVVTTVDSGGEVNEVVRPDGLETGVSIDTGVVTGPDPELVGVSIDTGVVTGPDSEIVGVSMLTGSVVL
jgi:hypothetical protein